MKLHLVAFVAPLSILALSSAPQAQQYYPFPRVIDQNGRVVGHYQGEGSVLFYAPNGKLTYANIYTLTGLSPTSSPFYLSFFYTTTDCSGTRYQTADIYPPFSQVDTRHQALIYPDGTPSEMTYHSRKQVMNDTVTCFRQSGQAALTTVKTVPLSVLGYTAPFHVDMGMGSAVQVK